MGMARFSKTVQLNAKKRSGRGMKACRRGYGPVAVAPLLPHVVDPQTARPPAPKKSPESSLRCPRTGRSAVSVKDAGIPKVDGIYRYNAKENKYVHNTDNSEHVIQKLGKRWVLKVHEDRWDFQSNTNAILYHTMAGKPWTGEWSAMDHESGPAPLVKQHRSRANLQ